MVNDTPKFLHDAKEFLVNVSEDSDWKVLLLRYTEFEQLALKVSSPPSLAFHLTKFSGPGKSLNFFTP